MIRNVMQKIIKCNHQNLAQCLFVFWPNPAGAALYGCLVSTSSAWKTFSESWETMMGTVAKTVRGRGGIEVGICVADDILRSAARDGSFRNDCECGAGTGINEEIWGRSERRLWVKHNPRSEWSAESTTRKEGKGKCAVDQIFEGKPTGVTSPSVSGEWGLSGQLVAHVIPKVKMDEKSLRIRQKSWFFFGLTLVRVRKEQAAGCAATVACRYWNSINGGEFRVLRGFLSATTDFKLSSSGPTVQHGTIRRIPQKQRLTPPRKKRGTLRRVESDVRNRWKSGLERPRQSRRNLSL
jgi:hypothetical protein